MEVRLDGRSAIITGSSMGLGLAMAKEFAASGADVAILARRPEVLEQAKQTVTATAQGGRVATFVCDVAKADDIQRTFDGVIKAFGKVDILINNAGQSMAMPSEQITDEIWRDDLELKLFAAIRLARLAWPGMKQRKWGRIINVLNTGAKAPRANGAPTAVSRAAGMAFMKVLAGEGAPHGILVNGMLVGQIVSDQIARRHAREGAQHAVRGIRRRPPARASRSAAWARPRSSPPWRASCARITQASPPAPRSTWTAAQARWCKVRVGARSIGDATATTPCSLQRHQGQGCSNAEDHSRRDLRLRGVRRHRRPDPAQAAAGAVLPLPRRPDAAGIAHHRRRPLRP